MPILEQGRRVPVSSRFPGNGKPIYSGYQTITATLTSPYSAQKGKIKFEVTAGDFESCDHIYVDFVIKDKRTPVNMTKCPCDFSGTLDIHIPTPAPANLAEYVAGAFRRHSLVVGNMLAANDGDTVKYTMLQPGYELTVTPRLNNKAKKVTATSTITTASSMGSVPVIGPGNAAFLHQSIPHKSPLRSRVAAPGWMSDPGGAPPRFLGIIRHEDVLYNNECDCFFIKDTCDTVFIEGMVQIPLEVEFVTMPDSPVIYARHTSDATVLTGKVGGFQILDEADPAPVGMSKVPAKVQIIDALGMSAIVDL